MRLHRDVHDHFRVHKFVSLCGLHHPVEDEHAAVRYGFDDIQPLKRSLFRVERLDHFAAQGDAVGLALGVPKVHTISKPTSYVAYRCQEPHPSPARGHCTLWTEGGGRYSTRMIARG